MKRPIQHFPRNAQRRYAAELNILVKSMVDLTKKNIYPRLPAIVDQAKLLRPTNDTLKMDDFSDQIDEAVTVTKDELNQNYPDNRFNEIVLAAAFSVSSHNRREVIKVLSAASKVKVQTVLLSEPYLETEIAAFTKQNVALIKSIPDRYFAEVEGIMFRGVQQGLSNTEIRKQIAARFDVSKNRSQFIARDQVGKLNGQLTQLRQETVGVKKYRWRTTLSIRVRGNPGGLYPKATPSHWTREGKVFEWKSPPSDGHPGSPYGCQCSAEPIL